MEIYVTEENIRDLIIYRLFYNKRTGKVDKVPEWLFAGKPYRELEAALLKFFKGGNKAGVWYTRQEAKDFLARSRNASILMGGDFFSNPIQAVTDVLKATDADERVIAQLDNVFLSYYKAYQDKSVDVKGFRIPANRDISYFVRKVTERVESTMDETNNLGVRFYREKVEKLVDVAYLYNSLLKHLPDAEYSAVERRVVRFADEILLNRVLDTEFFKTMDVKNAAQIVRTLASEDVLGVDAFSKEEMRSLLDKTASILNTSSVEKVEGCYKVLSRFKKYLLSAACDDEEFKKAINDNINIKKVALKAGIVLVTTPDVLNFNYELLTGESLSKMYQKHGDELFGNHGFGEDRHMEVAVSGKMKINLTPYELYTVLVNSPSLMLNSLTPLRLNKFGQFYKQAIDAAMSEGETAQFKASNFPMDKFLNFNNIGDIASLSLNALNDNAVENFAKNMKTLNRALTGAQVFNVMQKNINLFFEDNSRIASRMDTILSTARTKEQQEDMLNILLNESFMQKGRKDAPSKGKGQSRRDDVKGDNRFAERSFVEVSIEEPFSKAIKTASADKCHKYLTQLVDEIKDKLNAAVKAETVDEKAEKELRSSIVGSGLVLARLKDILTHEETDADAAEKLSQYIEAREEQFGAFSQTCTSVCEMINQNAPFVKRGKNEHKIASNFKSRAIEDFMKQVALADDVSKEDKVKLIKAQMQLAERFKGEEDLETFTLNQKRVAGEEKFFDAAEKYEFFARIREQIDRSILSKSSAGEKVK